MNCDMRDIPAMGLLGIVMHSTVSRAKGMYKEFDMNRSQASILFMMHQRESMSQKELAEKLNVTPPSITSAIQKMERAGYITRKSDESDQRVMRLALTEKGRSCIQRIEQVVSRMDEIMFRGMSLEEKLLFRRFLLQIYENLEKDQKD